MQGVKSRAGAKARAAASASAAAAAGLSRATLPGESFLATPVADLTFVAFDTEATGRHPIISGLVEIAAVKFRASGELLESRAELINPARMIPEEVIAVHGISNAMVEQKPVVAEVIPAFVDWMIRKSSGGSDSGLNVFLAHNAIFDVSLLQVALTRLGLPLPANPVLDTLQLARHFFKDCRNHKLRTLIEYLGQDKEAVYHRAEADSLHVMSLFVELAKRLGPSARLSDLVEAGGVTFFSKPFETVEDHCSVKDLKVARIGEAIDRGADLQIHYLGHGAKFRRVTPYSVLYSARRYYLNAFCHSAGTERTFKVNRIRTMELVENGSGELK